jgi:hypothetical protein
VLIDDKIACCGWYRCFMDKAEVGDDFVMRVRSHNVPALVLSDNEDAVRILRRHIDCLISHAENVKRKTSAAVQREVSVEML